MLVASRCILPYRHFAPKRQWQMTPSIYDNLHSDNLQEKLFFKNELYKAHCNYLRLIKSLYLYARIKCTYDYTIYHK